jgi:hypothetical protein
MAKAKKIPLTVKLSERDHLLLGRMKRKYGEDALVAALRDITPTRKPPGRPSGTGYADRLKFYPPGTSFEVDKDGFEIEVDALDAVLNDRDPFRLPYELQFEPPARSAEHYRNWRKNELKKLRKVRRRLGANK